MNWINSEEDGEIWSYLIRVKYQTVLVIYVLEHFADTRRL